MSNEWKIKQHLLILANSNVFGGKNFPRKSNKQYFPHMRTIMNHMYQARQNVIKATIDQDPLMEKVENWKHEYPNAHIQYHFFRPKMEDSGEMLRQKITKKNTN